MEQLLLGMLGGVLPSRSGSTSYTVTAVVPGVHVTLDGPGRAQPSVLPWRDIERVVNEAPQGVPLNTRIVDEILENPQYRHSSTMCALVLAMQFPSRVQRPAPS